jgi:multidrug resistance efflux pump
MKCQHIVLAAAAFMAVMAAGCNRTPETQPPAATAAAPPTNRVDINETVRQNLGITFARVGERSVSRTLRIPGRFELEPTARREYRVAAAGKVEMLVEQYQQVEPGTPLYRLTSPQWRELQRELAEAHVQLQLAQAAVDSIGPFMEAHEKHHNEIQAAVDLWVKRVATLEELREAGGARGEDIAQAQASLAMARSSLAETLEKEAELAARRTEVGARLEAARTRRTILLQTAAAMTGRTADELMVTSNGAPAWLGVDAVEVRAHAPGVVESIQAVSGAQVDENAAVITTVQPEKVRFRANAMQSDLGKLANGLNATVVAPQGGSLSQAEPVPGILTLAPTAESDRRTIEVVMAPKQGAPVPAWAKAGISGFLEVVVQGNQAPELAIPLACVVRDGTETIIFRRDPSDSNKAIRMQADLGVDDGRWVVIRSGVAEGNEIVLDGVYQLMVATSGSITKGGHFHPDGTFHEGKD